MRAELDTLDPKMRGGACTCAAERGGRRFLRARGRGMGRSRTGSASRVTRTLRVVDASTAADLDAPRLEERLKECGPLLHVKPLSVFAPRRTASAEYNAYAHVVGRPPPRPSSPAAMARQRMASSPVGPCRSATSPPGTPVPLLQQVQQSLHTYQLAASRTSSSPEASTSPFAASLTLSHAGAPSAPTLSTLLPRDGAKASAPHLSHPPPTTTSSASALPPPSQSLELQRPPPQQQQRRALRRRRAVAFALSPDHGRMPPAAVVAANARRHRRVPGDGPDERKFLLASRRQRSPSATAGRVGPATVLGSPLQLPPCLRLLGARFAAAATAGLGLAPHADSSSDAGEMLAACLERRRRRRQRKQERGAQGDVHGVPSSSASPPPSTTFLSQPSTSLVSTSVTESEDEDSQYEDRNILTPSRATPDATTNITVNTTREMAMGGSPQYLDVCEKKKEEEEEGTPAASATVTCSVAVGSSASSLTGAELRATRAHLSLPCELQLEPHAARRAQPAIATTTQLTKMQQELLGILRAVRPATACTNMLNDASMNSSDKQEQSQDPEAERSPAPSSTRPLCPCAPRAEGGPLEGEASSHSLPALPPEAVASFTAETTLSEESTMITVTDLPHDTDNDSELPSVAHKSPIQGLRNPAMGMAMKMAAAAATTVRTCAMTPTPTVTVSPTTTTTTTTTKTTTVIMTNTATMTVPMTSSVKVGTAPVGMSSRKRCWAALREGSAAGEPFGGDKGTRANAQPCWRQPPLVTTAAWGDAANTRAHARVYGDRRCSTYGTMQPRRRNYASLDDYSQCVGAVHRPHWRSYQMESRYSSSCSSAEDMREALGAAGSILAGLKAFVASVSSSSCYSDDEGLFVGLNTDSTSTPPSSVTLVSQEMHVAKVVAVAAAAAAKNKACALSPDRSRHPPLACGHSSDASSTPPPPPPPLPPSSRSPLRTSKFNPRRLRTPWPLTSPSSPSFPRTKSCDGTPRMRERNNRERDESLDDSEQMTVAAAAVAAAAIAAAAAAELFSDTEGEAEQCLRMSEGSQVGRSDASTGEGSSDLAVIGPVISKAAAFMSTGESELEKMGLTEDALEKMAQRILEDDTSRSDILWPGSQSMLWELSALALSSDNESSSSGEESPSTAINVMSSHVVKTAVTIDNEALMYPVDATTSEEGNKTWNIEVSNNASECDAVGDNINTSSDDLRADSKGDVKEERAQTPISWITLSGTVDGTSEEVITPLAESPTNPSSESRNICLRSTYSLCSNEADDLEDGETDLAVNSQQTPSDREESQRSEKELSVKSRGEQKNSVSLKHVKVALQKHVKISLKEPQEEYVLETKEVFVTSKSRESDGSCSEIIDKNSSNSCNEIQNDEGDLCVISSQDMSLEEKTYARVDSLSTDQIDKTLNFTQVMSECDSRTLEKTSAAESSTQELTVKLRPIPPEISPADMATIPEEQNLGQVPTSKGSSKRPVSHNTSSGDQTSSFPSYSFSRDTPLSDIKSRSSPLRICIRTVRSSSDSPLSSCEYFPPAFDSFYRKPSGPNMESGGSVHMGSAHSIAGQVSDTNTFSSSPLPLSNPCRMHALKRSASASSSMRRSTPMSGCWLSADIEAADCEFSVETGDREASQTRLSVNSEYSSDMYEVLREYESLGEESAYASGFSDIPEEPEVRKMHVDEIWTELKVVEDTCATFDWDRYSDEERVRFQQRKRPASCLRDKPSSHEDENEAEESTNSQEIVLTPVSKPFSPRHSLLKCTKGRLRNRDRYFFDGYKTCSTPIDVASSVSSCNDPPYMNYLNAGSQPFQPQPCTIMSVTETEETDNPTRNRKSDSSMLSPSNCELIFTPSRGTVEPIQSEAVTESNLTDIINCMTMVAAEDTEEIHNHPLPPCGFGRLAEALPSAAATRAALMVPTQISRPRDWYWNKPSQPSANQVTKDLEKPGNSTTSAGTGAAEGLKSRSSAWGCDCPGCGCGGDWGRSLRKTNAVNNTSSQESSIVPSEDVFANNPPQLAAAAASRAFVENTPLHGSADPTPPMRVMLKAHRPTSAVTSGRDSTPALVTRSESPAKAPEASGVASPPPSSNASPTSTAPSPRESQPTLPPLSTAITLANAQKEQRAVQLPPMRDAKYAPVCVLNGSVVLHPSDLGYGEPSSSFRPLRDALFPACVFSSPSSPSIHSSGTSQHATPAPSQHSLSPRPSNVTCPTPTLFAPPYTRPLSCGAVGGGSAGNTSGGVSGTPVDLVNLGSSGRGRRSPLNGMAAPYGSGLLDDHHHRSPHGSSLFMPWQFGHSITTPRIPATRNKCGRVRPAARFPRRPPHAASRHRSPTASRSHTPHPHVGGVLFCGAGGGRACGVHHHHRSLGLSSPFGSRTSSPLNTSSLHHHPHHPPPPCRSPNRSSTRTGLHSPPSMSPSRRSPAATHTGRPISPSSSRWRSPSPSQPSQSSPLSPVQASSSSASPPPLLWRSSSPTTTKPSSPGHRPPARQQPTLWSSKTATGDRRPASPWSNWRPTSPSSPASGNWRPVSPPLGRRSPTLPSWRQQAAANASGNAWRPASPPSPPPTWRPASPPLSRRPLTPLAQRPVTPSTMMSRQTVAMETRGSSPPRRSFSPTNLRTKPSRSWTRAGAPPSSSMQPPQPPAWVQTKSLARSQSPGNAGRTARRPASGHALDVHGQHRTMSPTNGTPSIGQTRNSSCNNAFADPLHPRSERLNASRKRPTLHRNISSPHLSSVSGTDDNSVHLAGPASVISLVSISSSTDLVGTRMCGPSHPPPRRLQPCWLPTERASAVVVPALDKGLCEKAMAATATSVVATATVAGKSASSKGRAAKEANGGGGGDKASGSALPALQASARRLCVPRLRKLRGSVATARSSSDRRVRLRCGGEANTSSSLALKSSASALRRRRDAYRLSRLEKKFPERARDSGGGGEAVLSARTEGGNSRPGSSGLIIGPGAQHAGSITGGPGIGCSGGSSVDPCLGRLDCCRGVRSDSDGDVKRCGPVMARRRAASRLRRSLPRVPRFLTRSLRRAQRLRGSRWMVVSATDIVHLVKQQKSIGGVSHIIRWETQEYAAKDAQKRRQRGRTPTSTPTPTPTPTSTPPSRRPRTSAQPSSAPSTPPTPPFTRTPLTPRTPTTPPTTPAYLLTPTLFPSDYGRSATGRPFSNDSATQRPWSMPTSLRASRISPSSEQISSRSNKNLSHSEPISSRAHKNILNSESMISRPNKIFLSSEPTTPRPNKNVLNSESTHHKSHKNRLSNEMARRFSEAVHRSIAIIQRSIQHTIQRSLVEKCMVKKPASAGAASNPSASKYANAKWCSWDYPGKSDLEIFEQKSEINEWKRPTSSSVFSCRKGSTTSAEYIENATNKTSVFHSLQKCGPSPLKSCCSINKSLGLIPKSSASVEFPRIVQKILDCVNKRPASAQCGKVGNLLNKSRITGSSRKTDINQERKDMRREKRLASAKVKQSDSSLREISCISEKDKIKILSHPRHDGPSALSRKVRRRAENEVSMILRKTRTYKPPQFSDDNASDESKSSIQERCERRMLITVRSSSLLSFLDDETSTSSQSSRNVSLDIVPLLPERVLKESPSTTSDSQYLRTSSESSEGSILTQMLLDDKRVTVPEFDSKPKRYSTSVINPKVSFPQSSFHHSLNNHHHVCRKLSHPPGVLGRSSKICVIINNLKNPVEYLQCQIRFTNTMRPSLNVLDTRSSIEGDVRPPSPNVNVNINYKKTKKA